MDSVVFWGASGFWPSLISAALEGLFSLVGSSEEVIANTASGLAASMSFGASLTSELEGGTFPDGRGIVHVLHLPQVG